MAIEFRLPDLGENVDKGTIVKVLVSTGDKVELDQPVVEVETGKAVVEVPANVSGTVTAVHVKEGDEVVAGQHVLTLAEGDGSPEASAPAAAPAEASAPTAEAVLEAPAVKEAPAAQEAPVAPAAPAAAPGAAAPVPSREDAAEAVASTISGDGEPIPAAPSVRRFAREVGVDLRQVAGTGPGGRISVDDIKAYLRARGAAASAAPATSAPTAAPTGGVSLPAPSLPDFSVWGEIERQKMSGIRRMTAQQMTRAWLTVPHVTQFDKADITEIERLRKHYSERVQRAGGKLTMTAILVKVVVGALKAFPQFNASIDMEKEEIIFKRYYNIGIAVDTEHGLVVPVIKDADRKSLVEIAVELGNIAQRARERKLAPEDMQGGTFTISNLGGIGGTAFTPIVNTPEVAILGVARSRIEPVYQNGEWVPRNLMPLCLSYDHRLIDGADGARFLRWIVEALEDPFLLALEG